MYRFCELEGNYRYLLRISIGNEGGGKKTLFLLCNPSTADATRDDTTTRNLQKWAAENGVGTTIIANLYAFRASSPEALRSLSERRAVGAKNGDAIERASEEADEVIVAWGNPPQSRGKKGVCKEGQRDNGNSTQTTQGCVLHGYYQSWESYPPSCLVYERQSEGSLLCTIWRLISQSLM